MTGSFSVDTQAMQKASSTFSDLRDALQQTSDGTDTFKFDCGPDYYSSPYGTDYQTAIKAFVADRLPRMVSKTSSISSKLGTAGAGYDKQDDTAATDVADSGKGA